MSIFALGAAGPGPSGRPRFRRFRRLLGAFEVHRELEPKLLAPELSDVNELLAYFFEDEDRLRNDYRTAIGR